jgi:hypothetical protein
MSNRALATQTDSQEGLLTPRTPFEVTCRVADGGCAFGKVSRVLDVFSSGLGVCLRVRQCVFAKASRSLDAFELRRLRVSGCCYTVLGNSD